MHHGTGTGPASGGGAVPAAARAPGSARTRPHDVGSPLCVRAHTHTRQAHGAAARGMVFAPGPSWQHAQRLRRRALLPRRRCGTCLAAAGGRERALAAAGQQAQTKHACMRGPKRPAFPKRERTRAARAQGTDTVGACMQWLGTLFVRCVCAFAANAAWASNVCAPAS
jgi:hypothetical protein